MQFAELVISDQQALMTRAAIDIVLSDPERYVMTDEERSDYERLAVFYGAAAVEPERFPLSPRQASRIKSVIRKAKGPAQPKSRRNKRKARQERRQSFRKRERAQRKEFAEQYNAAREAMEVEAKEMEEAFAEMQAKYEAEPKFAIYSGDGQLIMDGVPESAIRPQPAEKSDPLSDPFSGQGADAPAGLTPEARTIILPGELPTA